MSRKIITYCTIASVVLVLSIAGITVFDRYRFIFYIGIASAIVLALYSFRVATKTNGHNEQKQYPWILDIGLFMSITAVMSTLLVLVLMLCGVVDFDYTVLWISIPWVFIFLGCLSAKQYRRKNNLNKAVHPPSIPNPNCT